MPPPGRRDFLCPSPSLLFPVLWPRMLLCFCATLSYIVWPCVPLCHRPASWLAVGLAIRVCVSSGDVCGTAADLMSLGSLLVSNLGAITRLWKVGCEVLARRSLLYGTCWHESGWPERERPHGYWV